MAYSRWMTKAKPCHSKTYYSWIFFTLTWLKQSGQNLDHITQWSWKFSARTCITFPRVLYSLFTQSVLSNFNAFVVVENVAILSEEQLPLTIALYNRTTKIQNYTLYSARVFVTVKLAILSQINVYLDPDDGLHICSLFRLGSVFLVSMNTKKFLRVPAVRVESVLIQEVNGFLVSLVEFRHTMMFPCIFSAPFWCSKALSAVDKTLKRHNTLVHLLYR